MSLDKPAEYRFTSVQRLGKPVFTVRVVESVGIYINLMKQLFDFEAIRKLLQR